MGNSIGTNNGKKENFTNIDEVSNTQGEVFSSVSKYLAYKTKEEARNGLWYNPSECFDEIRNCFPWQIARNEMWWVYKIEQRQYEQWVNTRNTRSLVLTQWEKIFILEKTEAGDLRYRKWTWKFTFSGDCVYINKNFVQRKDIEYNIKWRMSEYYHVVPEDMMKNIYKFVLEMKEKTLETNVNNELFS